MISRRSITLQLLSLLAFSAAFVGCKSESRLPTFPVTGKVESFNGEVPAGANVTLHPIGGGVPHDIAPNGHVTADGSFKIGTYDIGDGAPAGEYAVTIEWFKTAGDGRGPNVLPQKYANIDTTPVNVTVGGSTDIPPIQIAN